MALTREFIPLTDLVRSICDCPDTEIPPEQPVRDTPGWDSMRAINFQMELESAYGVDLTDAEITGCSTLRQISEVLRQKGVSATY